MNRVGIYVSDRHIRQGTRISSQNCPIALGIQAVYGGQAYVGITSGYFYMGTQRVELIPCPKTVTFIRAFDSLKDVEPGIYHINIWLENGEMEDLSAPEKSHPGSV